MKVSELVRTLTELMKDGADPEVRILDEWGDVYYVRGVQSSSRKDEVLLLKMGSQDGSILDDDRWSR
jgi:hypothetical protein